MFKQMLQKSVPKYNSETGEPVLYVEFQDFLGQSYVDNPEAKKELQDIITAQTGKTVEIQMLVADKHQHTNLANITVDQAIKNNIHMDVVIEEDPDEEKENKYCYCSHTTIREVFWHEYAKIRDIQAKIPLPQAIWNGFWLRYCERVNSNSNILRTGKGSK